MRSRARALVGTCVLMLSVGGTAIAQDSVASKPARRLLWFGAGLGYGSLSRTCDVCPNVPSEGAVTGYVKVGVAADAQLQVGVELGWWRKDVQGTTITSGSGLLVVYVYPVKTSGLFVKGGLGGSLYREEVSGPKPASDTAQTTGFGLTVGVGYDRPLGAVLDVTPVLNFLFGSLGNIRPGGIFKPQVQQTLLQLALGIKLHY
jgi:hypothetical protein